MIYEDRGCAFAVVFSTVVAEDLWGEEEEKLNFKRLLLRPHPAHLRCARSVCRFFMPLLAARQEVAEETRFRQAEIASLLVR